MAGMDDPRIAEFLRDDAPPPRDAAFRIGVLQRRERQRFQRRSLILFGSAMALVLISAIGLNSGADLIMIATFAVLSALLAVSAVISVRGVQELMRRFRMSGKN